MASTTTSLDQIERVLTLPVPRERVWAALTEPDQMAQWFGNRAEFALHPGAAALFGWEEHGTEPGRIEAVEPPRRFAFRWRPYRSDPALSFDNAPGTLVEFTLDEVPEGTRLTLVESGFASLPPEVQAAALADNAGGWDEELGHLAALLSAGAAT